MIKVAVLEDNILLQKRLVNLLKDWDLVERVDGFSDNASILNSNSVFDYDILLADLKLNGEWGYDAIKGFVASGKNKIAIVISNSVNPKEILSSIKVGAVGYLHKDDSSIEIKNAIQSALKGQSPISPSIAMLIMKSLHGESGTDDLDEDLPARQQTILTKRELEVLNLITKGLPNAEAADLLGLSTNTVSVHIRNIYKKLRTNNRAETIYEARSLGIIE